MRISKRTFIIINVLLILIEVFLIYLVIKSLLIKDLISPIDTSVLEYIKYKINNISLF